MQSAKKGARILRCQRFRTASIALSYRSRRRSGSGRVIGLWFKEEGQACLSPTARPRPRSTSPPSAIAWSSSPSAREEITKSGIVLPDTAKEKPQRGTVIAAGAGRRDDDGDRIALDVKVGDQVLFAKYAGTEFKLDDEELLILTEKDILAIVSRVS